PIANVRVHVLDGQGQEVPVGVPGELCLGGAGLARGYYKRPELTAERFAEHPALGRLYHTGGVGRWRADGAVGDLGRRGREAKRAGFGVELGEVEAALASHPAVAAAAALARADTPGDQRLVAYVVPAGAEVSAEALRAHLRARLPEHMVPSAFVVLGELPLT